ncbi:MAG: competence/damage-inducible protein A [Parasporobacterium sp.]|nr:competence/damage-inducible protein A [Parasporobacterium sp.]
MIVEILCVGTEILLGNIVNTNAKFLSEELANLGLSVFFQTVVGDNPERLESALNIALNRSDIVITTGGLGPTQDDLTKEIIAKAMGKKLVENSKAKEMLEERLHSFRLVITENNYKQAFLPEGATPLYNNHGTAPGAIVENQGKAVIMLPGPPSEMTLMFKESVLPYLKTLSDDVIVSRTVKMIGIGESTMASMADDLINSENPTVAPYAKPFESQLRVTAKAKSEAEALKLIEPMVDKISERFKEYIYSYDVDESLEAAVVKLLKANKLHIACAESCTGGMLASTIINVPGSSDIINESFVTYSNEAKEKRLGVSHDVLEKCGAVSEEVASKMAEGVALVSAADIGIGITGIAGPDGGTKDKPVGLVYIGLYYKGNTVVKKLTRKGNRLTIRQGTVMTALDMIRRAVG